MRELIERTVSVDLTEQKVTPEQFIADLRKNKNKLIAPRTGESILPMLIYSHNKYSRDNKNKVWWAWNRMYNPDMTTEVDTKYLHIEPDNWPKEANSLYRKLQKVSPPKDWYKSFVDYVVDTVNKKPDELKGLVTVE